jgi:hypothetical protein
MAAQLGVTENGRVYLSEAGEHFEIALSRKARENIEQLCQFAEMACGYIVVMESSQVYCSGDVIASFGSDSVGRVFRGWSLLSIGKLD